jgi:predicted alpha/beta hydrolase family esterase
MECKVAELNEFFPVQTPQDLYAKEKLLIVSTNDPYMSLIEAEKLQNELDIEMKIIENAGHINSESGFGEWPWMLKELTKV